MSKNLAIANANKKDAKKYDKTSNINLNAYLLDCK